MLEVATTSTVGLLALSPRWIVMSQGMGGLSSDTDKAGVRALLEALMKKASEALPDDGGVWFFPLVLSMKVKDAWKTPLRRSGPQ